jgi:hypothetical protein
MQSGKVWSKSDRSLKIFVESISAGATVEAAKPSRGTGGVVNHEQHGNFRAIVASDVSVEQARIWALFDFDWLSPSDPNRKSNLETPADAFRRLACVQFSCISAAQTRRDADGRGWTLVAPSAAREGLETAGQHKNARERPP